MAIFSTETEVTTDVALDIEVTVQDQDGNDIECEIDGNDLELCVQINIQKIKEELEDEVKDEVRDELRQEIEDQFVADIAESVNPFAEIADLLLRVGNSYSLRQNRIKENTKLSIERHSMKSDMIIGLKTENAELRREVEELNTRLSAVVTIKIDPPKEDE